jgi:hypothetical protein
VGHLDEARFAALMIDCKSCGGSKLLVENYIDRSQHVMVGEADNDGRWAYDGEGFIDGVHRIRCATCQVVSFESDDCTRCHQPGALPAVRAGESRISAPRRCPKCAGLELTVIGFAPATTEVHHGKPGKAQAQALYGEPGFHVIAMACRDCDWAEVAEGCPMCGTPSPIRRRPG